MLLLVQMPSLGMAQSTVLPEASNQMEIDRQYNHLLDTERLRTSQESLTERLASGLAALMIGLYGYYNDDRGMLTKVVYSATQTAGVIMVSNAILDANQPSLLLMTDRYLNHRKQMDLTRFKRGIVLIDARRAAGEYKQLAYTSAILSGIYAYDGYRETSSDGVLKNVFYFLSFNFALVSAANFYRLLANDMPAATATHAVEPAWHLAVLPIPSVTLTF